MHAARLILIVVTTLVAAFAPIVNAFDCPIVRSGPIVTFYDDTNFRGSDTDLRKKRDTHTPFRTEQVLPRKHLLIRSMTRQNPFALSETLSILLCCSSMRTLEVGTRYSGIRLPLWCILAWILVYRRIKWCSSDQMPAVSEFSNTTILRAKCATSANKTGMCPCSKFSPHLKIWYRQFKLGRTLRLLSVILMARVLVIKSMALFRFHPTTRMSLCFARRATTYLTVWVFEVIRPCDKLYGPGSISPNNWNVSFVGPTCNDVFDSVRVRGDPSLWWTLWPWFDFTQQMECQFRWPDLQRRIWQCECSRLYFFFRPRRFVLRYFNLGSPYVLYFFFRPSRYVLRYFNLGSPYVSLFWLIFQISISKFEKYSPLEMEIQTLYRTIDCAVEFDERDDIVE